MVAEFITLLFGLVGVGLIAFATWFRGRAGYSSALAQESWTHVGAAILAWLGLKHLIRRWLGSSCVAKVLNLSTVSNLLVGLGLAVVGLVVSSLEITLVSIVAGLVAFGHGTVALHRLWKSPEVMMEVVP